MSDPQLQSDAAANGPRRGPRVFFRDVQYQLEYAAFAGIATLARALPLETSSAVSGWLWRRLAPWSKRHNRALEHLRLAFPDRSDAERETIARAMWENLGRIFAESFHLDDILDGGRIVFDDLDQWRSLTSKGGTVGCSAHFGNWEIASALAAQCDVEALGIYQRVKNPLVDARIRSMRARLYPGGLLAKSQAAGIAAIRHVRNGGALVMLADLRDRNGLPVPFFGRPAPSTTFPAIVARTQNAPLLAVSVVREPGVRFRIRAELIDVPRTDDRDSDIAVATARLQAKLEDFIRAHPEQWMWAHRRWG